MLLSQDNTGPSGHRTAIFVPNTTEVASLGDSGSTFHNVFLGVYGVGATSDVRGDGTVAGAAGVQGNGSGDGAGVSGSGGPNGGSGVSGLGSLTAAGVAGTVKLTLNKAAGTASAPQTAVVAWFVVN